MEVTTDTFFNICEDGVMKRQIWMKYNVSCEERRANVVCVAGWRRMKLLQERGREGGRVVEKRKEEKEGEGGGQ